MNQQKELTYHLWQISDDTHDGPTVTSFMVLEESLIFRNGSYGPPYDWLHDLGCITRNEIDVLLKFKVITEADCFDAPSPLRGVVNKILDKIVNEWYECCDFATCVCGLKVTKKYEDTDWNPIETFWCPNCLEIRGDFRHIKCPNSACGQNVLYGTDDTILDLSLQNCNTCKHRAGAPGNWWKRWCNKKQMYVKCQNGRECYVPEPQPQISMAAFKSHLIKLDEAQMLEEMYKEFGM